MGPGNPHGEESEATFTVEKTVVLDQCICAGVKISIRPELEIFW